MFEIRATYRVASMNRRDATRDERLYFGKIDGGKFLRRMHRAPTTTFEVFQVSYLHMPNTRKPSHKALSTCHNAALGL